MKKMPPFSDLYKLSEDERIKVIGHYGMQMIVGFATDDDKKADRYVEKLKKEFPQLVIYPLKGRIVMVKVGPPVHLN